MNHAALATIPRPFAESDIRNPSLHRLTGIVEQLQQRSRQLEERIAEFQQSILKQSPSLPVVSDVMPALPRLGPRQMPKLLEILD